MNSIDDMTSLKEKLEKLLRMVATGRVDAAVKLAEVLADAIEPPKVVEPADAYKARK